MKLDFETNAPSVSSIDEEFYSDVNLENSSIEALPMLRAGKKAAQEGKRAEARFLLLRVTEIEPGNEEAWMQLASISEYPEELLGFLTHVLEINPGNEQASEWARSTKNLLSQKFVQRGMDAAKDTHKDFARQCFLQAIAQDGENETAWLWLASVSDSAEEKTAHLKKVLSLNPENENAIVLLKSIKNQKVDHLLQDAVAAAVADERETACQMLEKVLGEAPELVEAWILKSFLVQSFEEKINCFEKILDLDDENELANVNWTSLLDIMSKVESQTQVEGKEQFSASQTSDFQEPATSPGSTSPDNTLQFAAALPDKDVETVQPIYEAQAVEEEVSGFDESSLKVWSGEEHEENFADSELERASEENEVFIDAAQNYTDYSQPQTEFPQEVSEDYSQYASDEFSLPQETLSSYYETEAITAPLEMPKAVDSQEFSEPEQDAFVEDNFESEEFPTLEDTGEENSTEAVFTGEDFSESPNEPFACPFCSAEEEAQAFVCGSCRTMLTLSDLEMLLAHGEADREILRQAVERMEDERNRRDFDVEDLKLLAIGQINLKNLRQGCDYLNEAAQINPNDVVLSSQVNSLKIRLAEIEEQQSIHDTMPKNRKILVVDDSATVRKLISGKLEKSGHEVFCAIDGLDALEKIKEFVPDLILLDINMPRMDGYQVCKLIRSDEATKDVPVVMISGKDGFFDKVRGRMAGTTGYITKPFGPETLMKMVETYIV
jgi:CheY-like chemotaxis protein/tetratricopeptide (TPR) repeat protein